MVEIKEIKNTIDYLNNVTNNESIINKDLKDLNN